MATQKEFKAMHRAMAMVIQAQDAAGWIMPEVKCLSKSVLQGLWVCANNKPPLPKSVLDKLAEDTAALEKARAVHKSSFTTSMKSTAS